MPSNLLLVSNLLSSISQEPPPNKLKMSACPTCQRTLTLPPSIAYLLRNYPDAVTPTYGLNRRIPRCKHCDLVAANNRAMDADLPPPEYKNPVAAIENHMEEARRFIAQDVRKVEMEKALVRMEERRRQVLIERDRNIRRVWEDYWGIWGPEQSGIGALYA